MKFLSVENGQYFSQFNPKSMKQKDLPLVVLIDKKKIVKCCLSMTFKSVCCFESTSLVKCTITVEH